jgi:hypothetical protein
VRQTLDTANPAVRALVDILTGDVGDPAEAVRSLRAELERGGGAIEQSIRTLQDAVEGLQSSDDTLCEYLSATELWRLPPDQRPPEIQQQIEKSDLAQEFIRALEHIQSNPAVHASLTMLECAHSQAGGHLLAFEDHQWRLVRPGRPPERQALKPGAMEAPLRDHWMLLRADSVEGRGRKAARISIVHDLGATDMRVRLDIRLWNPARGRFIEIHPHLEGPARLFGARATLGNAAGPLAGPCELRSGNGGARFTRIPFEALPAWLEMEWWQESSRAAVRERYALPIVT